MSTHASLERFRYFDPISVQHAAALVLSIDPEHLIFHPDGNVEISPDHLHPAVKNDIVYHSWKGNISNRYRAMQAAIRGNSLLIANDPAPVDPTTGDFHWELVTVRVADLKQWLSQRELPLGFFDNSSAQNTENAQEVDYYSNLGSDESLRQIQHSMHEIDPDWGKLKNLTVVQAAALLAGYDPKYIEKLKEARRSQASDPFFDSAASDDILIGDPKAIQDTERRLDQLKLEINGEQLSAKRVYDASHQSEINFATADNNPNLHLVASDDHYYVYTEISWERSTVAVSDLKLWLERTGITDGYFCQQRDIPGYLDEEHPRYPSKLAAAIKAWSAPEVVEEWEKAQQGKRHLTGKQAMVEWLTKGSGKALGFSRSIAEREIATVANWDTDPGQRSGNDSK